MKSRRELAIEYINSLPKCDICGGDFAYIPIIDKDTGKTKNICTNCYILNKSKEDRRGSIYEH